MWKAYLKGDAWVLSKIQDAYLWLLDRVGVYVGTLMFATYVYAAAGAVLARNEPLWLWLILLAMTGWVAGIRYLWQDKAEHERYNMMAMFMEQWRWRHIINVFLGMALIIEIITLSPLAASQEIAFLVYGYLLLIKIRERDKKPFFKPVEGKQELAMENSR